MGVQTNLKLAGRLIRRHAPKVRDLENERSQRDTEKHFPGRHDRLVVATLVISDRSVSD
jgi:hypothetical protein